MSTQDDIKRLQGVMQRLPDEIAKEFLARLNMRTPVDTGALQAANKVEVVDNTIVVSNDKDYFDYVEDGTPKMRPVGMLKITEAELPAIVRVALQRASK
jgi:hypothetical protein